MSKLERVLICAALYGVPSIGAADDRTVPAADAQTALDPSADEGQEPARPATAHELAYVELRRAAIQEYDAGNFHEARTLLRRAHELFPSARTLRALGMVEFELKNYVTSTGLLTEALSATVRPLDGDLRDKTQTLLHRARDFVGIIVLSTSPRAAEVTLDGEPVLATGSLPVSTGQHELTFCAPGFQTLRRTVRISGGEQIALSIVLVTPEQPVAAAPPRTERRERKPLYRNPWLWSAVGAVVLGSGTAIAVATIDRADRFAGTRLPGAN